MTAKPTVAVIVLAVAGIAGGVLLAADSGDTYPLTKVSATAKTITFSYSRNGDGGYRYFRNGTLVASTRDPSRLTVKFAFTNGDSYRVQPQTLVATKPEGVYPVAAPPPPPPPTTTTTPTNASVSVSPSGNDSSCSRNGPPCLTWQKAYAVANDGDKIDVAPGNYQGGSLSGSKPVTFQVTSGVANITSQLQMTLSNATFVGPVTIRTADPYKDLLVEGCSSNIEFRNWSGRVFYIYGSSSNIRVFGGDWGGYTAMPPNSTSDPAVSGVGYGTPGCGDGIVRNVLIDGVRFHDVLYVPAAQWGGAHPDCFESYGRVDGLTVRNSTFERCGNTFLGFYTDFGDLKNIVVENNLMRDIAHDSYWSTQIGAKNGYTCDLVFRYNTYFPNNPGALAPNPPPLLNCPVQQVYGNIIQNGPQTCVGWTYNVFETNPCGANAAVGPVARDSSYRLAAGSLAVGRGDPTRFPLTDSEGTVRVSPPDAGWDQR